MKSIWAHSLVKNEEKWIWYSVMSVINYVDKVLIWDTGSTDRTENIIKEIKRKYPEKVSFKQVGNIDINDFTNVRQRMLDETKSEWFLVLDGDEIWWEESIKRIVSVIKGKIRKHPRSTGQVESIVVPNIMLIGDIYHYQEKAAGRYELAGRKGHYALRAINRKIPGLKAEKPHGTFGWVDGRGRMIQEREPKKILFLDAPYLHATYLPRSSVRAHDLDVPKRTKKYKHEIGNPFPRDFYYPEVLFRPKPNFVPSLWRRMSMRYFMRALAETPLRKLKRRLLKDGKEGY